MTSRQKPQFNTDSRIARMEEGAGMDTPTTPNTSRTAQNPSGEEAPLFRLRAMDSAERMNRTLSPWIREMLSGSSPDQPGTLVGRHFLRRPMQSFTFNHTLAILNRFHRIVARSVSWKADLGPIDPNLFDRFALQMSGKREIGANNISELLKINRQDDRFSPMPLVGEGMAAGAAPSAAASPATPASPASPAGQERPRISFEEMRRRIEEAKQFRSNSATAEPDYVLAQRAEAEKRTAASSPSPAAPPQPGQPPRPAPAMPTPPAPQPAAAPPEEAQQSDISPRARRRRMARKVEYLSMPAEESGDDDGEPHFAPSSGGDPPGQPSSIALQREIALGMSHLLADLGEEAWSEPQRTVTRRTPGPARPRSATTRSIAARQPSRPSSPGTPARTPSPFPPGLRRVGEGVALPRLTPSQDRPVMRRALSAPGQTERRTERQTVSRVTGQDPFQRPFDRLRQSASGQMLVSRPQSLLRYLAQPSSSGPEPTRPRPIADSLTDSLSRPPEMAPLADREGGARVAQPQGVISRASGEGLADMLPVSLGDFARYWGSAPAVEAGEVAVESPWPALPLPSPVAAPPTPQPIQRRPAPPIEPERISAAPIRARLGRPGRLDRTGRPSLRPSPRPSLRPAASSSAVSLAQLQSADLRRPATVARLMAAPQVERLPAPVANVGASVGADAGADPIPGLPDRALIWPFTPVSQIWLPQAPPATPQTGADLQRSSPLDGGAVPLPPVLPAPVPGERAPVPARFQPQPLPLPLAQPRLAPPRPGPEQTGLAQSQTAAVSAGFTAMQPVPAQPVPAPPQARTGGQGEAVPRLPRRPAALPVGPAILARQGGRMGRVQRAVAHLIAQPAPQLAQAAGQILRPGPLPNPLPGPLPDQATARVTVPPSWPAQPPLPLATAPALPPREVAGASTGQAATPRQDGPPAPVAAPVTATSVRPPVRPPVQPPVQLSVQRASREGSRPVVSARRVRLPSPRRPMKPGQMAQESLQVSRATVHASARLRPRSESWRWAQLPGQPPVEASSRQPEAWAAFPAADPADTMPAAPFVARSSRSPRPTQASSRPSSQASFQPSFQPVAAQPGEARGQRPAAPQSVRVSAPVQRLSLGDQSLGDRPLVDRLWVEQVMAGQPLPELSAGLAGLPRPQAKARFVEPPALEWHAPASRLPSPSQPQPHSHALPTAGHEGTQPVQPPNLLDRIVQRDFAGTRQQALSQGALQLAPTPAPPSPHTRPRRRADRGGSALPRDAARPVAQASPLRMVPIPPAIAPAVADRPGVLAPASTRPASAQPTIVQPAIVQPTISRPVTAQSAIVRPPIVEPATSRAGIPSLAQAQPAAPSGVQPRPRTRPPGELPLAAQSRIRPALAQGPQVLHRSHLPGEMGSYLAAQVQRRIQALGVAPAVPPTTSPTISPTRRDVASASPPQRSSLPIPRAGEAPARVGEASIGQRVGGQRTGGQAAAQDGARIQPRASLGQAMRQSHETLARLMAQPVDTVGLPALAVRQQVTSALPPLPFPNRPAAPRPQPAGQPGSLAALADLPLAILPRLQAPLHPAVPAPADAGDAGEVSPGAGRAGAPGQAARAAGRLVQRQQERQRVEPVSALYRPELLRSLPPAQTPVQTPVQASAQSPVPSLTPARGADWAGQPLLSLPNLPAPESATGRSEQAVAPSPRVVRPQLPPVELLLQRLHAAPPPAPADSPDRPAPRGPLSAPRAAVPRAAAAPPDRGTAQVAPLITPAQVTERLERGGWRFKRRPQARGQHPRQAEAGVAHLAQRAQAGGGRPLAPAVRTLMERVLGRDFAGVRVQMASLGALGIEAAAQGQTIYLSPQASRLSTPQDLALLGHELTHVAARGLAPRISARPGASPEFAPGDLPLAPVPARPGRVQRGVEESGTSSPAGGGEGGGLTPRPSLRRPSPAPSLTRQLSRQLVQLSPAPLSPAREEDVAERVEHLLLREWSAPPRRGSRSEISRARTTQGSRTHQAMAQRQAARREFAPVSNGWPPALLPLFAPPSPAAPHPPGTQSQPLPASLPVPAASPVASPAMGAQAVDLLEREGWRFKRSARQASRDRGVIQRSVVDLSQRSGGMPLPERPRTLLEGVLQRDFRGVRVQTAGLEGLGVEAAARENTVYLQRETLRNLERPQNLALLGHELTHVAAAGKAPNLQRNPANSAPARGGLPLASLRLPPTLTALQRTPQAEEQVADRVESGLRSLLGGGGSSPVQVVQPRRVSAAAPLAASPAASPVNGGGGDLLQRLPLAPLRNGSGSNGSVSNGSVNNGSASNGSGINGGGGGPGAVMPSVGDVSGGGGGTVQRAVDSSLAQGISTQSMPVAQRMLLNPSPQGGGNALGTVQSQPGTDSGEPFMFNAEDAPQIVQRARPYSDPSDSSDSQSETSSVTPQQAPPPPQPEESGDQEEPRWEELAEQVYPILKRMLLMERERRPW